MNSQIPNRFSKAYLWHILPFRYKFIYWFVVTPFILIGCILPFIFGFTTWKGVIYLTIWLIALIAYALFEISCVKWYKKNGYL